MGKFRKKQQLAPRLGGYSQYSNASLSLFIQNGLWYGFGQFQLRANFLEACSKRFDLLLHLLDLAVFF